MRSVGYRATRLVVKGRTLENKRQTILSDFHTRVGVIARVGIAVPGVRKTDTCRGEPNAILRPTSRRTAPGFLRKERKTGMRSSANIVLPLSGETREVV